MPRGMPFRLMLFQQPNLIQASFSLLAIGIEESQTIRPSYLHNCGLHALLPRKTQAITQLPGKYGRRSLSVLNLTVGAGG